MNTYGYVDSNPLYYVDSEGLAKEKYKKPENPNKRKGADGRTPSGDRERNIGHPDGEEHSRRPKGGIRIRVPMIILPLHPCLLMPEVCRKTNESVCQNENNGNSRNFT